MLYIDRLGVDPARQGTGLGSWLLVRIEEVARASGARGLSLETAEMAEGNIRGPPAHGKDPHVSVHMVRRFRRSRRWDSG